MAFSLYFCNQMTLIKVLKLTPIRNEKCEIYKWEEAELWLSPMQIQSISFVEELGHTVVNMTNGHQIVVEAEPSLLDRQFILATMQHAKHMHAQSFPRWFYVQQALLVGLFCGLVFMRAFA